MRRDRLLSATVALVQAGRVFNVVAVGFILLVFAASFPARPLLETQLLTKYGEGAHVAGIILFLRVLILLALPVGVIIERLLRALRTILATVAAGEPFAPANAARLRTIGWMLLALQMVDLAFGATVLVARHLKIDYLAWQPAFTGWIAVLVAFVLVRVFAAGTAMRDDLDGIV